MRYLVLGTTALSGDRPLPGPRLRALLAALALRPGRPVTARALIAAVWWDEQPPADAAGALQALVSRLRRAIGRDAIGSGPAGYVLHAGPHDVDLHVFERLAQEAGAALAAGDPRDAAARLDEALALWRGPALADLADRTVAAGPEASRLTALQRRADAHLALGRAADVLPQLEELVAEHPLNEPFRALLIRALAAVGRGADALAAYEGARRVLADRLGADPGPELRALHARLLDTTAPAQPAQPAPVGRPGPPARGNLRARLTSFVGREEDLRAIRDDLARHRLVTLVGAGGAGKTRLAEQAGAALADRYPDGVWVAELAPVERPAGVPRAVLNAVGRGDTTVFAASAGPADPTARLLEHCAHRSMLLVLDNCEHVVDAAAGTAETLLAHCPGVTVLATSREPLAVPGEAVRPVEPLPPPTAHRLFAERAATVRPGFDPAADPRAVAEICRRLDGLPLAIELAAARLRLLTPRQIADRLDDRFRLLTSGHRTVLPRQQTLRAVVDWSWDLLGDAERTVLRRMSVFAGGCTLAAAEAVCADDGGPIGRGRVLGLLGSLVDKSLVVADPADGGDGMRYRFLETVHEYAVERAAEHPADHAASAARHTAHVAELVATAAPMLHTGDQLRWLERLENELDNVRAALERLVAAGDEDTALAVATGLGWFWWLRNYRDESAGWIRRIAALGELPSDRGDPKFWPRMDLRLLLFFVTSDQLGMADIEREDVAEVARRITEAYREPGPHSARFPGLLWPFAGYLSGGMGGLRGLTDEVVANCRTHGGDWELACALMFRTHTLMDTPGGLAGVDDWAELAELAERTGDRWVRAQVHGARAELEMFRGRYPQARADFEASVRLCDELGASSEIPFLVARMAELAVREGDDAAAGPLLVRAEQEADHYGIWDVRTYIRYLQGTVALRAGDVRGARRLCDLTRQEARLGTPPPMLSLMVGRLEASVTEQEGDPRAALAAAAVELRAGLRIECPEAVLAAFVEEIARLLAGLAEPASAARLLGLADTLRGELPRSVPEEYDAGRARDAARSALGAAGYAAAHDDGRRLTPAGAADLVDAALRRIPAAPDPVSGS